MSQGKVNLPLYFLSLESSMFCKGPLLKEARAESKRGPCWPGNSLVEESEEVSHDHDDHAGKGDEDLLDLVHPLSWVLQFCNKRGFQGTFHPHRPMQTTFVSLPVRSLWLRR